MVMKSTGKKHPSKKVKPKQEEEGVDVIGPLKVVVRQKCNVRGREVWLVGVMDMGNEQTYISLTNEEAEEVYWKWYNKKALTRILIDQKEEGDANDENDASAGDPVIMKVTAMGIARPPAKRRKPEPKKVHGSSKGSH